MGLAVDCGLDSSLQVGSPAFVKPAEKLSATEWKEEA
jgi:hypothetical protein